MRAGRGPCSQYATPVHPMLSHLRDVRQAHVVTGDALSSVGRRTDSSRGLKLVSRDHRANLHVGRRLLIYLRTTMEDYGDDRWRRKNAESARRW